jgi:hypothetical protein
MGGAEMDLETRNSHRTHQPILRVKGRPRLLVLRSIVGGVCLVVNRLFLATTCNAIGPCNANNRKPEFLYGCSPPPIILFLFSFSYVKGFRFIALQTIERH